MATPSSDPGAPGCVLCATAGGELVWQDARLRVILPDEPAYPGFTRVVWRAHAAEMTDLAPADRDHLMAVVWRIERMQRELLAPDKVNLASLGNVVPHVHWHVIPRWRDDAHFPQSVWSVPATGRDAAVASCRARALAAMPRYRAALASLAAGA